MCENDNAGQTSRSSVIATMTSLTGTSNTTTSSSSSGRLAGCSNHIKKRLLNSLLLKRIIEEQPSIVVGPTTSRESDRQVDTTGGDAATAALLDPFDASSAAAAAADVASSHRTTPDTDCDPLNNYYIRAADWLRREMVHGYKQWWSKLVYRDEDGVDHEIELVRDYHTGILLTLTSVDSVISYKNRRPIHSKDIVCKHARTMIRLVGCLALCFDLPGSRGRHFANWLVDNVNNTIYNLEIRVRAEQLLRFSTAPSAGSAVPVDEPGRKRRKTIPKKGIKYVCAIMYLGRVSEMSLHLLINGSVDHVKQRIERCTRTIQLLCVNSFLDPVQDARTGTVLQASYPYHPRFREVLLDLLPYGMFRLAKHNLQSNVYLFNAIPMTSQEGRIRTRATFNDLLEVTGRTIRLEIRLSRAHQKALLINHRNGDASDEQEGIEGIDNVVQSPRAGSPTSGADVIYQRSTEPRDGSCSQIQHLTCQGAPLPPTSLPSHSPPGSFARYAPLSVLESPSVPRVVAVTAPSETSCRTSHPRLAW